jgi:subtilase family serine protease
VTADTVLTFQLTVTDNQGATGSATVNVTVNDVPVANVPPTANAGNAQTVNEGSAVTLSGTGTDSDGTIASYAWTQTAGPAVTLTNANTAVASFTAPPVTADTVLTFQLTVTDNQGATGTATTNVTVANVAVAEPDLTITALTAPVTSIRRGRTMTVSYTLQNLGTADVPLTATAIYLSTDATITTGDRAVGAGATGQLAAGASTTRNAFVFIPFRTTPGTYYLGAFVDPNNRQVESDETNNSFTGATIQVTP